MPKRRGNKKQWTEQPSTEEQSPIKTREPKEVPPPPPTQAPSSTQDTNATEQQASGGNKTATGATTRPVDFVGEEWATQVTFHQFLSTPSANVVVPQTSNSKATPLPPTAIATSAAPEKYKDVGKVSETANTPQQRTMVAPGSNAQQLRKAEQSTIRSAPTPATTSTTRDIPSQEHTREGIRIPKIEVTKVQEEVQDSRWVKVRRLKYKLDGRPEYAWDVVKSHDAVSCLLYHTQKKCIVLVRQFRPAVFMRESEGNTQNVNIEECMPYEMCAGLRDKAGKDAKQTVIEEIEEECGFKVHPNQVEQITTMRGCVGVVGNRLDIFYCEVDDTMKVSEGGGLEEEYVQIQFLTMADVERLIGKAKGAMIAAGLYAALYWFKYNKPHMGCQNRNTGGRMGTNPLPVQKSSTESLLYFALGTIVGASVVLSAARRGMFGKLFGQQL